VDDNKLKNDSDAKILMTISTFFILQKMHYKYMSKLSNGFGLFIIVMVYKVIKLCVTSCIFNKFCWGGGVL